jgi:hypothetical protein
LRSWPSRWRELTCIGLGHINVNPNRIRPGYDKQFCIQSSIAGIDQGSDIHVPLGYDTRKWGVHVFEGFKLFQPADVRERRRQIRLSLCINAHAFISSCCATASIFRKASQRCAEVFAISICAVACSRAARACMSS